MREDAGAQVSEPVDDPVDDPVEDETVASLAQLRHDWDDPLIMRIEILLHRATAADERMAMKTIKQRFENRSLEQRACTAVLALCSKRRSISTVHKVFSLMRAAGMTPGRKEYKLAMRACAGSSQMWAFYEEMVAMRVRPDANIFALMLAGCRTGGRIDSARDVWSAMRAAEVAPSAEALRQFLGCCLDARDWRSAEAALREAQHFGALVSERHWQSVMLACAYAAEADQCERIFKDLPFQPSVVEYTILISAYANHGGDVLTYDERATRADAALARMAEAGVEPNEFTFKQLIHLHWCDPDRVCALLDWMAATSLALTPAVALEAGRALLDCGRVDDARDLTARLADAGATIDANYYQAMTLHAQRTGHFDEADRLHREALRLKLPGYKLPQKVTKRRSKRSTRR